MANTFTKGQKITSMALGLLQREIILPQVVWTSATVASDWQGAAGDTVTIRVPSRTTARVRQLRGARPYASEGNGIIDLDELVETSIDVVLDQAIYSAVGTTDEENTLDIVSYGEQILVPMVRSVAEGAENKIAQCMQSATYANTVTISAADTFPGMVDVRRALNDGNVPLDDRWVVIGSGLEAAFLKDDHFNHADQAGDNTAFRQANIGRIAGFNNILVSQALDPDEGYAFHRTAYSAVMVAPKAPQGAKASGRQSLAGIGMRWLVDYDFRNVMDRTLIDMYMGCTPVVDGPGSNETQTITITGTPTGGTFTLTYRGETTAPIAYNATAAAVQSALRALSGLNASTVSVAGGALPGTLVTVTFAKLDNVIQLTANGAALTGGTSPAVTVATTSQGGQGAKSFVRAVKLALGA